MTRRATVASALQPRSTGSPSAFGCNLKQPLPSPLSACRCDITRVDCILSCVLSPFPFPFCWVRFPASLLVLVRFPVFVLRLVLSVLLETKEPHTPPVALGEMAALLLVLALPALAVAATLSSPAWNLTILYDATADTVFVSSLSFYAVGGWTLNLSPPPSASLTALSGSVIVTASGVTVPATCGGACSVTQVDARTVSVSGLSHGGADSEAWTFSLSADGTGLAWEQVRSVGSDMTVTSDRLAQGWVMTGAAPPIHGYQIPSWCGPCSLRCLRCFSYCVHSACD